MPGLPRNARWTHFGPELDAEVRKKIAKTDRTYNSIARELFANWVGKPELANTVEMGNPVNLEKSRQAEAARKPVKRRTAKAKGRSA